MTLKPPARHPAIEPPLLAGMIRGELQAWMQQVHHAFVQLDAMRSDGLVPTTLTGKAVFDDASTMLMELSEKMELLSALSETYSGQRDSNQERLFLYALLCEVIDARHGKTSARFVAEEPQTDVAPVYGNKHWLKLLLIYLVRELDASVNPADKIVFTFRQMGNHMILATSTEAIALSQRNRPRPRMLPDSGLTASFCERIVELHGGTLRLRYDEDDKILAGIALSLPTSVQGQLAHGHCEECPLLQQIENYATDLAVLMDRCEQLEGERNRRA
ncbi:MAG: hypothetical protein D4S02_13495 [Rhodocyclaceae bacterium]|nr:MAG: hypothetical protein D4S02_13495 [Rhodocyclaceae bacterium]